MNYELALKLKNAGFPQENSGYDKYYIDTNRVGYLKERIPAPELIKIPNLEELIEACGDKFGFLVRQDDGKFRAYPTTQLLKEKKEWYLIVGTPIVAVSNLYLAIHEKHE